MVKSYVVNTSRVETSPVQNDSGSVTVAVICVATVLALKDSHVQRQATLGFRAAGRARHRRVGRRSQMVRLGTWRSSTLQRSSQQCRPYRGYYIPTRKMDPMTHAHNLKENNANSTNQRQSNNSGIKYST